MEKNIFLKNYFEGQIKDIDDIPAVPPTFKKKENKEYQQIMEKFIKDQKKIFVSWRKEDKQLQNLRIINMDKYNPLGFNIYLNYKEIFIKNLQINCPQEFTFIKLRIASKICIYNYVIFLGEDANKDLIPILIYDTENYYSLNLDNWDQVEDFYKEGKYILIINPNYTIYDETMYETEGTDGLLCRSPNETILFKDEKDIDKFLSFLTSNNFEGFKSLGDIMIMRKYYDKAIFFYEKAINIDKNEVKLTKIYSLLCECYIRYKYFTKGLDYINKCFNTLDILINEKKDESIDKSFIMTSLLRKLKCFIGLRNFEKAYETFNKIKDDKEFQNYYKLDEAYINKTLVDKNNKLIIDTIKTGYNNYLGKYNIIQMLNDEKDKFYLNNGDYINPKVEIYFDSEKGIKMIANNDINVGEYILVEKAIYMCRTHDPNNNFETGIKLETPFHITGKIEYIDCINNLIKIIKRAPLDYKDFFALYNGNNLKESYGTRQKAIKDKISNIDVELIEKIFKLNSYKTFRYFYSINKLGIGLWKIFSLFNHSCLPNTTNYGIGDIIFVVPNKLIKKGEEITVLYLSTPKYYEARKGLLKEIYNFECNCDLCETEKNNRENNKNLLTQYDDYIQKLCQPDIPYFTKNKAFKEFPEFLKKYKDTLSEYEIGKAYVELSSCSPDFNQAYKYYALAERTSLLDFETRKLNLNKIIEFGDSLIEQGDTNISEKFKELYKKYANFYKLYYKCNEKDIEMFIRINKEQKMKDLILQQEESITSMMPMQNYLNKNK